MDVVNYSCFILGAGFANFSEYNSSLAILLNSCIDNLVQDCSISIANALEILQSCTKPSTYFVYPKYYLLPLIVVEQL